MGYSLQDDIGVSDAPPKTHTRVPRSSSPGLRYFSPTLGMWLSRDPIGERGGLSLHAFCGNRPVNRIDALGLQRHWDDDPDEIQVRTVPFEPGAEVISFGPAASPTPSHTTPNPARVDPHPAAEKNEGQPCSPCEHPTPCRITNFSVTHVGTAGENITVSMSYQKNCESCCFMAKHLWWVCTWDQQGEFEGYGRGWKVDTEGETSQITMKREFGEKYVIIKAGLVYLSCEKTSGAYRWKRVGSRGNPSASSAGAVEYKRFQNRQKEWEWVEQATGGGNNVTLQTSPNSTSR